VVNMVRKEGVGSLWKGFTNNFARIGLPSLTPSPVFGDMLSAMTLTSSSLFTSLSQKAKTVSERCLMCRLFQHRAVDEL
jgi:hypothetical protein